MRIKNLLFLLLALPLALVSCQKSEPAVDEVKNPTVAITVGEATETSIAFTITSTAADEVKYLVVEASEATPTATEVLTNGTVAEANVEAGCYVAELKAETEYTIVAAAKNAKAVVKAEAKMTTKGNGNEPEPPTPGDEYDVEFKADDIYVAYYGDMYSAAYNYYVILSDVGVNLKETDISFKENGIYYIIDLYAADAAENNNFTVPNGTYKAATSSAAGTFGLGDYGAGLNIVNGEPTYYIYASGEVVVSENKIVATITMEDGQKHQITYEGSLYFGENGDDPVPPTGEFEATHTATKWLWGGASSYGNKYAVMGDNFSIDVHFPAKYASQTYLEQQSYTWTSTTWFGYNDFDNEFTTRSFKVEGTDVAVDAGTAVVTATGDEYHIELTLEGRDGFTYMIQYDGKLDDKGEVVDDNAPVAFTYMSKGTYNSYWCYQYELKNAKGDSMILYINDTQGNETNIYTDDSFIWTTRDYCYYAGDFSTYGITVNGMSYEAISGAMVLTSDGAGTIEFTMTLNFTNGTSREFSFAGKIGQENAGGEVTKLATPSVAGIVAGNSATVSWQEIAGAANYTVTLNGTDVKTVNTAYITYQNLEYDTTYTVSVVANPADAAVNSASDPGTATFTTEANPGGGEGGGNTGGESFEGWVFDASLNMGSKLVTLTDGTHTVVMTLNEVAGGTFYLFGNGVLNVTEVTVNGVAAESASGTMEMSSSSSYYIVLDCYINGVHYTGTSNNPVV